MFLTKLLDGITHYLIGFKGTHALVQNAVVGIQESAAGVVVAAWCYIGCGTRDYDFVVAL